MADMKYLQKRGGHWHYVRRIPKKFHGIDKRGMIRKSLGTDSLSKARKLRDEKIKHDGIFWNLKLASVSDDKFVQEEATYEKAKLIVQLNNVALLDIQTLAKLPIKDILTRLKLLEVTPESIAAKEKADALLGVFKKPSMPISKAFELYTDKLAIGDLIRKSDGQKKSWHKAKLRAVTNFTSMHGDLSMDAITREHARDFYDWWVERVLPEDNSKGMAPNTANRDLGNLRKLYREYWKHAGDEERLNPFRNLRIAETEYEPRPAFETAWVQTRILTPGIFNGLNEQAVAIIYAMIETGCRPSELANLIPKNIRLDSDIPYLHIRTESRRKLKSKASKRVIPLVGVSLLAMKHMPGGFPRYKDKEALLSASLMKAFRARKLFPTPRHTVYSLRHSFEKRMLEANIDYGLRCELMGHSTNRPKYGDGGSLVYRRDQLLKIAYPISKDFRF